MILQLKYGRRMVTLSKVEKMDLHLFTRDGQAETTQKQAVDQDGFI